MADNLMCKGNVSHKQKYINTSVGYRSVDILQISVKYQQQTYQVISNGFLSCVQVQVHLNTIIKKLKVRGTYLYFQYIAQAMAVGSTSNA